jgi:hypothetical protein
VLPSPDYTIDPAATAGCRSPSDTGCLKCCQGGDPCNYRDGNTDWSQYPGTEPWYFEGGSQAGACPVDCQPCASCSQRDQEAVQNVLTVLQQTPNCDCNTVVFGNDDCFAPTGCACLCGNAIGGITSCPPAP